MWPADDEPWTDRPPTSDEPPPPRRFSRGCLVVLIASAIGLVIVSIMVCQVLGAVLPGVAPEQP